MPFKIPRCELPHVFQARSMYIPLLSDFIGNVHTSEFIIHVYAFSLFAGLIAPFGGFFASALKRGLKIKAS